MSENKDHLEPLGNGEKNTPFSGSDSPSEQNGSLSSNPFHKPTQEEIFSSIPEYQPENDSQQISEGPSENNINFNGANAPAFEFESSEFKTFPDAKNIDTALVQNLNFVSRFKLWMRVVSFLV